jgi:hypothetical protein
VIHRKVRIFANLRAVHQQVDSSTSQRQESEEARKSSTWVPPRGYDRTDPYEKASDVQGDMTKSSRSRRPSSAIMTAASPLPQQQQKEPRGLQRQPKEQPTKPEAKGLGNKDRKRNDKLHEGAFLLVVAS